MPFVYAVSFIFSSPSKANVLLIIWQLVAAFAAMLVVFILGFPGMIDASLLEFIRVSCGNYNSCSLKRFYDSPLISSRDEPFVSLIVNAKGQQTRDRQHYSTDNATHGGQYVKSRIRQ